TNGLTSPPPAAKADVEERARAIAAAVATLPRPAGGERGFSVPLRALISSSLRLQAWMHDLATLGDQRALDDLVLPVDLEGLLLLVDHELEEGQEVLRVEARGVDRHLASQIE